MHTCHHIFASLLAAGITVSPLHAAQPPMAANSGAANNGPAISVDTPRGGWRDSTGEAAGFRQQVNYPAASVNSIGQSASALIKGHIAAKKKEGPATLVVNGVALPLLVDESNNFSRPYAFGAGSNSIEVRSPGSKERKRVQFYDASSGKPQARLRVVLSWDTDGTDLDLHVVSPDGQHVSYGNRVGSNCAALDLVVTTGYGPEIYANPTPPTGVYQVYVNYYGTGQDQQQITTAQVAIITQEGTLSEKRQIVQVPMRKPGELTLMKSFSYP